MLLATREADLIATLISHRLPLAEVNEAIDLMLSGEALRVVLDTTTTEGTS